MNDNNLDAVARRLATAAGHIKAIERMVQEDDPCCITIVHQIQAVQGSLRKVSSLMLEAYLRSCLAIIAHDDDVAERQRMLREVASIFHFSDNR